MRYGDGVPTAYAMHFGFVEIAELLGRRGAKRDLRFAAGLGELDVVKSWFDADGSSPVPAHRAEQRPLGIAAQACAVEVRDKVCFEVMVTYSPARETVPDEFSRLQAECLQDVSRFVRREQE